jgi:hypothetical protein
MSPDQVKALLHRARRSFKRAWERAEGWALAPVFAMRSMLDDHRSEGVSHASVAGAPIAGIAQSLTVVEKAVTSAVIAAVALTGMPSAPSRPAAPPGERGGVGAGSRAATADASDPFVRPDSSGIAPAAEPSDAVADVLALAQKAKDEVEEPQGGSESSGGGGDGDAGGGDDNPLGGPGAQQKKKAVDTVERAADQVSQTLDRR